MSTSPASVSAVAQATSRTRGGSSPSHQVVSSSTGGHQAGSSWAFVQVGEGSGAWCTSRRWPSTTWKHQQVVTPGEEPGEDHRHRPRPPAHLAVDRARLPGWRRRGQYQEHYGERVRRAGHHRPRLRGRGPPRARRPRREAGARPKQTPGAVDAAPARQCRHRRNRARASTGDVVRGSTTDVPDVTSEGDATPTE
jgi:hypothetical protein